MHHLGHEYLSDLVLTILVLLLESEDENNIEPKMKYLEERSVLMENFMNGHFKSE